jgi:pyrroline-5-carboxylate reductase
MPSTVEAPAFAVIGLGRMAEALMLPLLDSGAVQAQCLQAAVATEQSRHRLAVQFPDLAISTDPSSCLRAPELLLAVKPQQLIGLLDQLGGSQNIAAAAAVFPEPPLLISIVAGLRLERLQTSFPGWHVVRAVANTPALVRRGLVGLAAAAPVSAAQLQRVHSLFGLVGEVWDLPETQLDAFLALTSSGPAFAALVAEALADGSVAAGLPRSLAQELAIKMLAGTAALLEQQQLHPAQLKDMVSSPGGTTIAGLRVLERGQLRASLIEAVVKAADRSAELA